MKSEIQTLRSSCSSLESTIESLNLTVKEKDEENDYFTKKFEESEETRGMLQEDCESLNQKIITLEE